MINLNEQYACKKSLFEALKKEMNEGMKNIGYKSNFITSLIMSLSITLIIYRYGVF
jgi:hypothetical protein